MKNVEFIRGYTKCASDLVKFLTAFYYNKNILKINVDTSKINLNTILDEIDRLNQLNLSKINEKKEKLLEAKNECNAIT